MPKTLLFEESDEELLSDLRRHENYKRFPYNDPLRGAEALSAGFGYNLRAHGLERDVAEFLLHRQAARSWEFVHEFFPPDQYPKLTRGHYVLLANMVYQLGEGGFKSFRKMISAIRRGDFATASLEMRDSKWFNQTTNRAQEIISRWNALG